LQKTKHEKSDSARHGNGKSDAQQQLVRCAWNRVDYSIQKLGTREVLDGLNSKFKMHNDQNNVLVNFVTKHVVLKKLWCFTEQLLNSAK